MSGRNTARLTVLFALTWTVMNALQPSVAIAQRPTQPPPPIFDYPYDGQILDLEGHYLLKAHPVADAEGYAWSFCQDGKTLWETNHDDGQLVGPKYQLLSGSAGHRRFKAGDVDVTVRAYRAGRWSKPSIITIKLRPRE